jgi:protein-tyrosine phosphatase
MAEAVLRGKLADAGLSDEIVVESSGTGGWHVGDGADPRALSALRARGYDLDHRARQFASADFLRVALVVALDAENRRHLQRVAKNAEQASRVRLLMDFDPTADPNTPVPDPYYGGPSDFDHALDLIERGCDGLVSQITRGTLMLSG